MLSNESVSILSLSFKGEYFGASNKIKNVVFVEHEERASEITIFVINIYFAEF